jgi:hypothetical protein
MSFYFLGSRLLLANYQTYLKNAAALLGEAGREIFPKQSEILVDRGDTGNFLNLPYFGGTIGYKVCIQCRRFCGDP